MLLMVQVSGDIAPTIGTVHLGVCAQPSGIPGDRGQVPNWWRSGQVDRIRAVWGGLDGGSREYRGEQGWLRRYPDYRAPSKTGGDLTPWWE